jgi:hypothetical protein
MFSERQSSDISMVDPNVAIEVQMQRIDCVIVPFDAPNQFRSRELRSDIETTSSRK